MSDATEFAIAKMRLAPGDLLVFRTEKPVGPETVAFIQKYVDGLSPGTKTLVIDRGVDLAVLTKAEIEART